MANLNQQIPHILTSEQYEENRARITQIKEYVNAMEIQNEVGHESYLSMQHELERRVQEGERARDMLQSIQQPSTFIHTRFANPTGGQQLTISLPMRDQQPPIAATIEEIGSSPSQQPSTSYPTLVSPAVTQPVPTFPAVGGHSGPQGYQNFYWIQNDPVYSQQSNRPVSYSYNPAPTAPMDGNPAMGLAQFVSRPVAGRPLKSVPLSNGSSTAGQVYQSTASSSSVHQPSPTTQNGPPPEVKQNARDDIYRILQSHEPKTVEAILSQVYACHKKNVDGTGTAGAILNRLQFFPPQDVNHILYTVYNMCKMTAGPHNRPSLSREVTSTQTPLTGHSESTFQLSQELTAQQATLRSGVSKSKSEVSAPAIEGAVAPRAEQDISQKMKEILKRLQEEHKSTRQAAEFINSLYAATYARTRPEDPLVLWAFESLQHIPINVVQKALKFIMEQMRSSTPVVNSSNVGTSQGARGATRAPAERSTSSSSSSLAGALVMPTNNSLTAQHSHPVKEKNSSASKPIELPTAAEYLAKMDVQTTSATPLAFSERNPSSDPAQAAPAGMQLSHQQANITASSSLPLDYTRRSSLEIPAAGRIPAQVNRSSLAESILKELGMPTGTMPALLTKKERRVEWKKERQKQREASAAAAALLAAQEESTYGLAQAISGAQSSYKALTLDPSVIGTSSSSLEFRRQTGPAHILRSGPSYDEPSARPASSLGVDVDSGESRLSATSSTDPQLLAPNVPVSLLSIQQLPIQNAIPSPPTTPSPATPSSPIIPQLSTRTTTVSPPTIPQISTQTTPPQSRTSAKSSPRARSISRSASAEPLFLVGDSDPDSMMEVDHLIDEPDFPKHYMDRMTSFDKMSPEPEPLAKDVREKLDSLTSTIRSGSGASSSDIDTKISSSKTKTQPNVKGSRKDTIKRSRFYVEAPPLPEWARTKRIRTQVESDDNGSDDELRGLRDVDEQNALDEAFSRLRVCPCRWRSCKVVLNCTDALSKHLLLHIHEREGFHGFECRWQNCTRRFRELAPLERHVKNVHSKHPISCAYQGCKNTFSNSRHLLNHNLTKHRNDPLKDSASPTRYNETLPPPNFPDSVPSYALIPVSQTPISADRHARLGPWVLRQIYGPVNTKALRYNAAVPLRLSRRLDKSIEEDNESEPMQSVPEGVRCMLTDRYDFLDSTLDANKPYGNLPNDAVTRHIADGLLLVWETGSKEREEGTEAVFSNVHEQTTDDELLLRPGRL